MVRNLFVVLVIHLLMTGGLTWLAVTWPNSVIYGLMFGILPGVVLMIMPTWFLWSATFAVWTVTTLTISTLLKPTRLKSLTEIWLASAFGAVATFATLSLVTLPGHSDEVMLNDQKDYFNVASPRPITLTGDIVLETGGHSNQIDHGEFVGWPACSADCVWLLTSAGVNSVTINDIGARRYAFDDPLNVSLTLEPRAIRFTVRASRKCKEKEFRVPSDGPRPLGIDSEKELTLWQSRVKSGLCLAAARPSGRYDFRVRAASWQRDAGFNETTAEPKRIYAASVIEIRGKDNVTLFRKSLFMGRELARPLRVEFAGDMSNPHFRWVERTYCEPDCEWESRWEARYEDLFDRIEPYNGAS